MKKSYTVYRVTSEIQIPRVPNFFLLDNDQTIPISAIEDDSLREVGKLWTEALVERAAEQRASEGGKDE